MNLLFISQTFVDIGSHFAVHLSIFFIPVFFCTVLPSFMLWVVSVEILVGRDEHIFHIPSLSLKFPTRIMFPCVVFRSPKRTGTAACHPFAGSLIFTPEGLSFLSLFSPVSLLTHSHTRI